MIALLLAAALEVIKPVPELEMALNGGTLVFTGGMLMRDGVHYNGVEARGVGDFLEAAVAKGLIRADRKRVVHSEVAARLMRDAERAAARIMLLESAEVKARQMLAGREQRLELRGALERLRTERTVALGSCRRLAKLPELSGVLNCP